MTPDQLPTIYLSYDGLTDNLGQSQVLPYLKGLEAKGRKITVISAEKSQNYSKRQSAIRKQLKGTAIEWIPFSYTSKPPILSTLFDLVKLHRLAKAEVKKGRAILHCRSYIAALVGLKLKRKYGLPVLFDMRGFWADERMDGQIWSAKNPLHRMIYRYFKRKEVQFFKHFDEVVSLTEAGRQELRNQYGVSADRISVIPCCTDPELFDEKGIKEVDQIRIKAELGLNKADKVLIYLGSIGTWYLLAEMLAFFHHLTTEEKNWTFLFISPTSAEEILKEARKQGIAENKIVVKSAAREEIPLLLSLADLSVFFIRPCYSKIASSPTKMGESLMMGLPVVGNKGVGDVREIIEQFNCGYCLNDFEEAAYKQLVLNITTKKGPNPKDIKAAADFYDLNKGIETYHRVYRKLDQS